MKRTHRFDCLSALCIGFILLSALPAGATSKYKRPVASAANSGLYLARVLHSFSGVNGEGLIPNGGLLLDSAGNLYGATVNGGSSDSSCGTVFKLAPPAAGGFTWTERIIHSFSGPDGCRPAGDLVIGAGGALYGTTSTGGPPGCWAGSGCGLVFQLVPPGPGASVWSENTVHVFSIADGDAPAGGVVADASGTLYGMTTHGGNLACLGAQYSGGCGVVFKLSPPAAGRTGWTVSVLHAFGSVPDGAAPNGKLLLTRTALYGTTTRGGKFPGEAGSGSGTVFQLTPPATSGTPWAETVLYSFSGPDGAGPSGNLISDTRGDLYGTTVFGGIPAPAANGTVFALSPPGRGQPAWAHVILHTFYRAFDGINPTGLCAEGGNIYGTTSGGGTVGVGTYYVLTPPAAGGTAWTQSVLHSFNGFDAEGPSGPLIADGRGTLYGVGTSGGALNNNGTVFKLTHW